VTEKQIRYEQRRLILLVTASEYRKTKIPSQSPNQYHCDQKLAL
jgi:hypothetical protein